MNIALLLLSDKKILYSSRQCDGIGNLLKSMTGKITLKRESTYTKKFLSIKSKAPLSKREICDVDLITQYE